MVLPRILSALVNEAAFAIGEGVADGMIIDLAMTLGTNYPRGPISWGREMGYGKIASILNHLHQEYGEERYRLAPQLLRWSRL